MYTGSLVTSTDEWNKRSCEVAISPCVVGVVVAPTLAALTEVEGNVVAAPLEIFESKSSVATLANVIFINADAELTFVKKNTQPQFLS